MKKVKNELKANKSRIYNYSTSQNKPRQNIDGTWMEQVQSKCFSIVLIHFI